MINNQIADVFEQLADLLEFQGANPFRVRAYRGGARTIRDMPEPVAEILADESRKLTDIQGIGKDLSAKCATLVETGELPQLTELLKQYPDSVMSLLRIPGLGPKKAAVLHKELKIESLEQLKATCEAQQVRGLKGFGAKTEQAILQGMQFAQSASERLRWVEADVIAQDLFDHLQSCSSIEQMDLAGSYRRRQETIGDLDILVVSTESDEVMDCFGQFDQVAETMLRGDTKMSVRLKNNLQVDLRVVPAESFGAALQYFTGSKDHNVVVRGRAKKMGMRINEYGVFTNDNADTPVAGATEAGVYEAIGLPWFPPELRESRQEFDWAKNGDLPVLIELNDIRGDLHMHTTATDGKASIEEMVAAAKKRGMSYIAITDHSKRVSMAFGLDAERLLAQWEDVDRINAKQGKSFTVLKGIECDILEKGGMDLPDDVLAQADWVVASVHYGQNQPREQITERILGALTNPYVSAIAHPTGRLINRREPYEVDIEAVLMAAKEHGKLMELNANPHRLDLNDVHCAAAKRMGIPIVISTDAHSTEGMDVLRYGVLQARRAGLTKHDVANTRTWNQMKNLIKRCQS